MTVAQFPNATAHVERVDMMGLEEEDLMDEVEDIINVNDFIELSGDAQVIFV